MFFTGGMRLIYRLILGFSILLLLLLALGGVALQGVNTLAELNAQLFAHPFAVSNAILDARRDILEIRRLMYHVLTAPDHGEVYELEARIHQSQDEMLDHLQRAQEFFLGDTKQIDRVRTLITTWWIPIRHREISLVLDGRAEEAMALHRSADYQEHLEQIKEHINYVVRFSRDKAQEFSLKSQEETSAIRRLVWLLSLGLTLLGLTVAVVLTRAITRPLGELTETVTRLAQREFTIPVPGLQRRDEIGALARAIQILKQMAQNTEEERWIKGQVAALSSELQQAAGLEEFAHLTLARLAPLLQGGYGAFYTYDPQQRQLEQKGSYGFHSLTGIRPFIALGEGILGACAQERQPVILHQIPEDYIKIGSALGESPPRSLLAAPLLFQNRLLGAMEIAAFQEFTPLQQLLLEAMLPVIALNLENLGRYLLSQELLVESQRQSLLLRQSEAELQAQSEELRLSNDELQEKGENLERQTEELRASEEELKVQSETLQVINEELREKGEALENQAQRLIEARQVAERAVTELEQANRYKSEFLANMSHELRTPLNSLLILARTLASNDEGNLTADQQESAQVVYDSGNDLLRLINDILDLSKVEAGKMEVTPEMIPIPRLISELERRFRPLADDKAITLEITISPQLPAALHSDGSKLERILNNLLANAIKFTQKGGVTLTLEPIDPPTTAQESKGAWIAFAVSDTGIGIPPDQLERIFNAFEQVDGTTSRRYGGTGLGLSIVSGLTDLLGGEIRVSSQPGAGSRFTLLLPVLFTPTAAMAAAPLPTPAPPRRPQPAAPPTDKPHAKNSAERTILIIEDDPQFARILEGLARDKGFSVLLAANGERGIALAAQHPPEGVILDLTLPGMDGWAVLERLKAHPALRDIPVHIISARDESRRGLSQGATGYWIKPVSREQIGDALEQIGHFGDDPSQRVLIVEDDANARKAIATLVGSAKVEATSAANAEEALHLLHHQCYDCMILDINLPGMNGIDLLERATAQGLTLPPVIIHSGRELTDQESYRLREFTDSVVIKGERAPERLLDEVTLFLHKVNTHYPPTSAPINVPLVDPILVHKTVLVVDDDMRNTFALSKLLRAHQLQVLMAQDGCKALSQLQAHPEVDLVIMDIMMPEMDGYEAMTAIRAQERWRHLPVLAITAKAMSGEREKCLEAGATDYLAKPIDADKLLSMMRVWLSK